MINNARKLKVLASGGSRPAARYYQSPGVKFDGMKPGFLSKEARLCLGIGVRETARASASCVIQLIRHLCDLDHASGLCAGMGSTTMA